MVSIVRLVFIVMLMKTIVCFRNNHIKKMEYHKLM